MWCDMRCGMRCGTRVRSRRALLLALAVLGNGCASAGTPGGGSDGTDDARRMRAFDSSDPRDAVALIGSFAAVPAVTVSRRYVYAAGTSGLAVYDRILRRWLPPLSLGEGQLDALPQQPLSLLAGDPNDDAVWIGVPGMVSVYRPALEQWQRVMVVGVPDFIAFDRSGNGDALVCSGGQYLRISRVGTSLPLTSPPSLSAWLVPPRLADLAAQYPVLRSQPQSFLRSALPDRLPGSIALLSGAASPDRSSELWLGTDGDGLFRFDPTFLEATALPYGLLEPSVGALAPAADGVWVAGLGLPQPDAALRRSGNRARARGGLGFVADDLQRFRWLDGSIAVPLVGVRSHALATRGAKAWIGTDRGLVRVMLDGRRDAPRAVRNDIPGEVRTDAQSDLRAWTVADGLPDNRVLAVAARDGGAWAGTLRGVVFVSDTAVDRAPATPAPWANQVAVYALLQTGDTLWLGSEAGLVAVEHPHADGRVLRTRSDDPVWHRPVRALAWSDSVLLAATDDAVWQISMRGSNATTRLDAIDPRTVGRVSRMGVDARSIWVAGENGVLFVGRDGRRSRLLRRGIDLAGPVTDVVAGDAWWWLGTWQGLVRMRRTADGGIP